MQTVQLGRQDAESRRKARRLKGKQVEKDNGKGLMVLDEGGPLSKQASETWGCFNFFISVAWKVKAEMYLSLCPYLTLSFFFSPR